MIVERGVSEFFDRKFRIVAPAKVNLALHITGRRDDGYHELSMLNIAVSLCDEIEITILPHTSRTIELSAQSLVNSFPSINDNLITKAIDTVFGSEVGFLVKLHKNIPLGGGLGGGSSNAGSILRLASQLFPAFKSNIISHSVSLGSDVPYFLSSSCFASVEGVGEVVHPLSSFIPKSWSIILYLPPFSVNTAEAYRTSREMKAPFSKSIDPHQWMSFIGSNDLVPPTEVLNPELKRLLSELKALNPLSGMSGSGSTLFSLLKNDDPSSNAEEWARKNGLKAIKASILETFPNPVEVIT